MFLPIGDSPNPKGFVPWVTWVLIATNIAIHLLLALPLSASPPDLSDPAFAALAQRLGPAAAGQLTAWDVFVEAHGFKPGAPSAVDLLTAMFLHANLAHLGGNMLFLWIYGDNVEHRLGRAAALATYLATGAAATIAFATVAADPDTPLIGASGAISGALGAYFVLFPRNRVRIFVFLLFFVDVWLVPAPLVLGAYVLIDNLLPFLTGASSSTAYGAHLGGFVAGALVAFVAERTWLRTDLGASGDPARADPARAHIAMGDRLAANGQLSAAFQHYLRALDRATDPATAEAAKQGLRGLPLDPRLAARLGL